MLLRRVTGQLRRERAAKGAKIRPTPLHGNTFTNDKEAWIILQRLFLSDRVSYRFNCLILVGFITEIMEPAQLKNDADLLCF
jgi:hypothetical protein